MAKRNPDTDWLDDDEQGPGETVDRKMLCRIMGITNYALTQMIDRGLPVLRHGDKHTPWQFEVGTVSKWMLADAVAALDDDSDAAQYREAKRAKLQEEYEKLKAENAATRRTLVTVDEAVTAMREEAAIIRKHLGAIPAAIMKALAALPPEDRRNASIVETVIEDAINAALTAITEDNGVEHAEAA